MIVQDPSDAQPLTVSHRRSGNWSSACAAADRDLVSSARSMYYPGMIAAAQILKNEYCNTTQVVSCGCDNAPTVGWVVDYFEQMDALDRRTVL